MGIEVVANILSIHHIDTVAQVFCADVVIRGTTVGLAALGGSVTPEDWQPRISVLNMISNSVWEYSAKPRDDNELSLKWRFAGTFAESFELQHFPRDRQDLSVRISSSIPRYVFGKAAPAGEVQKANILKQLDELTEMEDRAAAVSQKEEGSQERLAFHRRWLREQISTEVLREVLAFQPSSKCSIVQASNFCMANIYSLHPRVRMHCTQTKSCDSSTSTVRPQLVLSISISRCSSYFFWNIEALMFLLTLMGGATFACERSAADRLGLSLTLVLTAVAFKFVISADLPKISYLTLLDKYVLGCFVFLALVVLENAFCEMPFISGEHGDYEFAIAWLCAFLIFSACHTIYSMWQLCDRKSSEARHEARSFQTSQVLGEPSDETSEGRQSASAPLLKK